MEGKRRAPTGNFQLIRSVQLFPSLTRTLILRFLSYLIICPRVYRVTIVVLVLWAEKPIITAVTGRQKLPIKMKELWATGEKKLTKMPTAHGYHDRLNFAICISGEAVIKGSRRCKSLPCLEIALLRSLGFAFLLSSKHIIDGLVQKSLFDLSEHRKWISKPLTRQIKYSVLYNLFVVRFCSPRGETGT